METATENDMETATENDIERLAKVGERIGTAINLLALAIVFLAFMLSS